MFLVFCFIHIIAELLDDIGDGEGIQTASGHGGVTVVVAFFFVLVERLNPDFLE